MSKKVNNYKVVTCPYCGNRTENTWTWDRDSRILCAKCHKEFVIMRPYETVKLEEETLWDKLNPFG